MALYVISVVAAGLAVLIWSLGQLYVEPPNRDFLYLLALTLASSILPIKLPNVSANISVSETFIFVGTLRYGAPVGVPLVFLDALIICFRMARRGTAWQKIVFSLAAPALSLAAAAAALFHFTHSRPLAWVAVPDRPAIWLFFLGVLAFTAVYFLLNTGLIAVAIAIDKQMNVFRVWRQNFSTLGLNYAAGTSIAVLLVYNTADIQWAFLFFVFPLLLVLYLTYRWTTERVQQAERHVAEMTRGHLLLQMGRLHDAAVVLNGRFDLHGPPVVNVEDATGVVALGRLALHTGDGRRVRQTSEIAKTMLNESTPGVRRHATWLLSLQATADGDDRR